MAPVSHSRALVSGSGMRSTPLRRSEILTIVNVLTEMEWTLVNMVYSDEALKNVFLVQANRLKVCVDSIIALSEDMTAEEVNN